MTLNKLLQLLLAGSSDQNFRFADLVCLLTALGFLKRVRGSHHIFHRDGIEEIINLQPLPGGKAKPYQVKQVRHLVLRYHLKLPE